MPDDRSELLTPEAAEHHSHLKPIAHMIPELDPDAQILLLLGWDILQVHKARDHEMTQTMPLMPKKNLTLAGL